MGTSSSSSGPGSGISFDPPWLDDISKESTESVQELTDPNSPAPSPSDNQSIVPPIELAPPRRFANARRQLGEFISSGNRANLRKALGNYSRRGMGGAANVAQRMRVSTSLGAGLYQFLHDIQSPQTPMLNEWSHNISQRNLSDEDISNEIIAHVFSDGGSLDEESCKRSMSQAMADLLEAIPDVDLLHLSNNEIWFLLERFLANEAFSRVELDIGQMFESAKYSDTSVVLRMNEVRAYLISEISVQIEALKRDVQNPSFKEIQGILHDAIEQTFSIFEEEV